MSFPQTQESKEKLTTPSGSTCYPFTEGEFPSTGGGTRSGRVVFLQFLKISLGSRTNTFKLNNDRTSKIFKMKNDSIDLDQICAALKQKYADTVITLAHGSGGKTMQSLIGEIIIPLLGQPANAPLEDQIQLSLQDYPNSRLAVTTDSYVVTPLFFPGSSIGHLAVNGTVNDLAVGGAEPVLLSCGLILEEGLPIPTLIDVLADLRKAADSAGVFIGTGDTKVVERGSCDQLFINTTGIGFVPNQLDLQIPNIQPGDKIVLNGNIGDHGVAILAARGDLSIQTEVQSDCCALNQLIQTMLTAAPDIRVMRDVTRGGVATVLNEFAQGAACGIELEEAMIPINTETQGFCELLGLDALYLANEGKVLSIVPPEQVDALLTMMHQHPYGKEACVIGEVVEAHAGTVVMHSGFGGSRVVDMLVGDQLPRIC